MSDRLMVMNEGKIEEIGKADEVYYHPSSEYTSKLIDAIPKGDLAAIRRRMERQKSAGASC
jgi:peptide/nickel transport system ATP-binding protein